MSDNAKLKAAIHYICWKAANGGRPLGKTKLHKVLWFADNWRFKIKRESITGATYVKGEFGPFIREINDLLDELAAEGKLQMNPPEEPMAPYRLITKGSPDMAGFETREIGILEEQLEYVTERTAEEISEKTHGPLWQETAMGEEMNLLQQHVFNKMRKPSGQGLAWANAYLDSLHD